ncbi:DNA translocase FtsK 4TM domain-containing protein [Bombilactobacillus folatiphilus]|uniref:DNA translocase FtsK n=1 Tax=Bombilactobacillus folatiphilus TaxID=2923362 RepID=A0ABY4P7M7_9LACO|nr:DNA translocase FtsK 4TM domain-containing protein [Bombilactobacillus folatiphilus]UQS81710.1 DNA translocase FtsK 4TM domain-containing protein [Bombilactobacillus folatiphilus]
MPKKTRRSRTKVNKKQASKNDSQYLINLLGLILVVVSLLADFQWGIIGRFLADIYRLLVGNVYQLLAILSMIVGVIMLFLGKIPHTKPKRFFGGVIFVLSSLTILHAILFQHLQLHNDIVGVTWRLLMEDLTSNQVVNDVGGGIVGAILFALAKPLFSLVGTYVICGLLIIIGLLMLLNIRWLQLVSWLQKIGHGFLWLAHYLRDAYQNQPVPQANPSPKSRKKSNLSTDVPLSSRPQPRKTVEQFLEHDDDFHIETPKPAPLVQDNPNLQTTSASTDYQLPSVSLLKKVPTTDQSQEYSLIDRNRKKLRDTLASFGVTVDVKKATLGPTVTKYEIQPAVGVKVSKILNLADDLALALAAKDLRIEAPIPGKPYIGIEVPNQHPSFVSFREVVENQPVHKNQSLTVPLGKDVYGQIAMCDLTKLPHLLIAGSTGSGKSVAINTIVTGILMQALPQEVKMVLIDPKMVELSMYNGIPHLLIPVVTDAKKANSALQKAVQEMERRYQLFEDGGYRKIEEYNQDIEQNSNSMHSQKEKLPYIIIVVDELSDLMMVAGKEVEGSIVRLAQKARAAGLHLILATQRPSVDVITGLIKANIPSRMAFAVSSGIDSRTILDGLGAEKLLGRGDMLFEPIGQTKPTRIQGAYISTNEVEQVVSYISKQQTVSYDENLMPNAEGQDNLSQKVEDEYWQAAVELVAREQKASVSMLQRHFQIGYNRAARLVDAMEERKIVGPMRGSKPRQVLIEQPSDEGRKKYD